MFRVPKHFRIGGAGLCIADAAFETARMTNDQAKPAPASADLSATTGRPWRALGFGASLGAVRLYADVCLFSGRRNR